MSNLKDFINKYFPDAFFQGGEYHCRCPVHNDIKESLHITQGGEFNNNGSKKILIHCKAGCDTGEILKKLGADWSEINGQNPREIIKKRIKMHYRNDRILNGAEIFDIYDYQNENGGYLYSKVRFLLSNGKKEMRYVQVDYKNETIVSYTRGSNPILYNLPALLESIDRGFPVYIVEGEKDVHTLRDKLNYTATTAGSASDWRKEFSRFFRGAFVVIMPDNDKAGETATKKILHDLLEYAFQVKIVYTSQQPGGDVTDYLIKDGGTVENLKKLINEQKYKHAVWLSVYRDKLKINPDLLAACIEKNEHYLIIRRPDNKNELYIYQCGVYKKVNKSAFIANIIRPYIPRGYGTSYLFDNTSKLLIMKDTHVVKYEDLNRDENYINVKNGLFNINTWKLENHNPAVLTTIQLDVEYDSTSTEMHNFNRFIKDLIKSPEGSEDLEKKGVIQEYIGLTLSNISMMKKIKQALFLISYVGNTGKSTLLRVVGSILGKEHIASIDLTELDYKNSSSRFTLGGVNMKRLISCGDQSSAIIKDSSRFKKLTGGDNLLFEEKGKQGSYETFNGGIIVAGNQIPTFADDSGEHVYKRMLTIPLQNKIVQKDSKLETRMLKEKSAIFNWFLEGLRRVRNNNYQLSECKAGGDLLKFHAMEFDSVKRFRYENYIETGNPKDLIRVSEFYQNYKIWCDRINCYEKDNGRVIRVNKNTVKQRMQADGFFIKEHANIKAEQCDDKKNHRGIACYGGLRKK